MPRSHRERMMKKKSIERGKRKKRLLILWRPLKKFKKEKRQKYFVREDYWEFAAASTAGGEKLVLRVSFARVTTAMSLIYSCIKSRPDQKPQRRRITRV